MLRFLRLPPPAMTALVGSAPDCARVVVHLRRARRRIGRFDASPHSLSLLCDAVRSGGVTAVVAIGPDRRAEQQLRDVLGALDLDLSLYVSPLDGVRPEARLYGILPVRALTRRPIPPWGRVVKEVADRLGAAFGLALLLPVLLPVAGLLRARGGPVFAPQWREGRNGAAFPFLRFAVARGGEAPTGLGRLLRRTGIERLPVLLNVLRGEMALVGPPPRPVAAHAGARACAEIAPDYPWRHRVKPGLTGLAQVAGLGEPPGSPDDLLARLALDLAYIREWSVGLDLRLLLLTAARVLGGGGGTAVRA